MINNLYENLKKGKIQIGLAYTFCAPGIIECMGKESDFVWIDGQHGQFTYEGILNMVRAADCIGVDSVVRVPGHDSGWLSLYADTGASAIMVPIVNNKEEAVHIAEQLNFAPYGKRSFGGQRLVTKYGIDYNTKRKLMVIAQIETVEGIKNAHEIIAVEGIDMLFFGPADVKNEMGLKMSVGIFENKSLLEYVKITAKAAKAAGKLCGTVSTNIDEAKLLTEIGYTFFSCGVDSMFLKQGANKYINEFLVLK